MVAIIWLRLELKHIYNGFNKSLLILGRRDLNSLKKSDYVLQQMYFALWCSHAICVQVRG